MAIVPERFVDSSRFVPPRPLLGRQDAVVHLGGGVPADGVAAVLNVTVTQPTGSGHVTVFDDDLCTPPLASTLDYVPGQTVANQVVSGLSAASAPCAYGALAPAADIRNSTGSLHYVVDVFGYLTGSAAARTAGASGPSPAPGDDGPQRGDVQVLAAAER